MYITLPNQIYSNCQGYSEWKSMLLVTMSDLFSNLFNTKMQTLLIFVYQIDWVHMSPFAPAVGFAGVVTGVWTVNIHVNAHANWGVNTQF